MSTLHPPIQSAPAPSPSPKDGLEPTFDQKCAEMHAVRTQVGEEEFVKMFVRVSDANREKGRLLEEERRQKTELSSQKEALQKDRDELQRSVKESFRHMQKVADWMNEEPNQFNGHTWFNSIWKTFHFTQETLIYNYLLRARDVLKRHVPQS